MLRGTINRRGALSLLAALPALLAGQSSLRAISGSATAWPATDVLLLETDVAGTAYAGTRGQLAKLLAGQALILRREPQNPHDARAILVLDRDGTKLGYLSRRHNRVPAAMMDAGLPLQARISALTPERHECLRLNVTLPAATAAAFG